LGGGWEAVGRRVGSWVGILSINWGSDLIGGSGEWWTTYRLHIANGNFWIVESDGNDQHDDWQTSINWPIFCSDSLQLGTNFFSPGWIKWSSIIHH
jgi:hypothetical protein